MSHKIEISDVTHARLSYHFPNEKNVNHQIRKLFEIALKPKESLTRLGYTETKIRSHYVEEVTNITYNRLVSYFPKEKGMDSKIRKLLEVALEKKPLKPMSLSHRDNTFKNKVGR